MIQQIKGVKKENNNNSANIDLSKKYFLKEKITKN